MTPPTGDAAPVPRIEPVATSTAAFLGASPAGPEGIVSPALACFAEYERAYGVPSGPAPGYLWHAARSFFEEGGRRLYVVRASASASYRAGLRALESIDDVSIVAAPGATIDTARLLIAHAEKMRYRFAVLDSGPDQTIDDVRSMRAALHSNSAALYYPWLRTTANQLVPPSGIVAGIYARVDQAHGVHKAPANEPVHSAAGLAHPVSQADQEVLNAAGINCFRTFPGRGLLLWGARTLSSDPEWKYVNVRRYIAYLEHSIDRGTQWCIFEPNGDALWSNVRRAVSDFLHNEWQSGALLGNRQDQAFFVRCDRSTMTQNDIDNGRLVVEIGVAPTRPAEFVILRIGQWTADHKP